MTTMCSAGLHDNSRWQPVPLRHVRVWTQAVILGVGMTAAMVTVALQSGTAGDLVSC
jgi:hypothetical protein